jgi:DMSO/TMAO reductase YedYZ molybdopterin-dependent catalytic subunit
MTSNAEHDIDPRLVLITREPFNAELPLQRQAGVITPTSLFYVRSHFAVPNLTQDSWRLRVGGAVEHALELTFDALRSLSSKSITVTTECAGNGRSNFSPNAEGEPWQHGAVSTAEWTGVPLRDVLALAQPRASAVEALIRGADSGHVGAAGKTLTYERSLTLAQATHADVLLAYAMNGDDLPPEHGYPVRLIVPGWYGMASVKWVASIDLIEQPFTGFYQQDRYIMAHPERGETATTPLQAMAVRALVTYPTNGSTVTAGTQTIRGVAWSGAAPVAGVDLSLDGGASWLVATIVSDGGPYAWRRWEYRWNAQPGIATIHVRAKDEAGRVQPVEADWNRLGYCNNAIVPQKVTVI